jgi:hypothetical protein
MYLFSCENDTGPRESQVKLQTENSLSVSSTHCQVPVVAAADQNHKVKVPPLVYIHYREVSPVNN